MKATLTIMALLIPQISMAAGAWIPAHTNADGTYVPGHFEGNTDGTVVVPVQGYPTSAYPATEGQRQIVPSEARNYLPHNGDATTTAGDKQNGLQNRENRGFDRGHRR